MTRIDREDTRAVVVSPHPGERRASARARPGPRPWASAGFTAAGLAAILASLAMGDNGQLILLALVQSAGGVAILLGVRRHRPRHPGGWLTLAGAWILFGVGVGWWLWYSAVLHEPFPYPGWPDVFFVPAYLGIAVALALMVRRRAPAFEIQAVLDAVILSVGLAYANWELLTGPAVTASHVTGQQVITVVYPLFDVVMVGLMIRLLLIGRPAAPALWLLAASVSANLGGDTAYATLSRFGGYHVGALPDQLWMLAGVLAGAAALHPSMRGVADGTESRPFVATRVRLGLMAAGAQVPVVVAVVMWLNGEGPRGGALVLTVAVLLPLLAIRSVHATGQLRRLVLADQLTGLSSRERVAERLGHRDRHRSGPAALLFIDLDRFKNVNDTLGHGAGDRVLVEVGERLRGLVRSGDVVARFGGDEFIVLATSLSVPADAERLADRVVARLDEPFTIDGRTAFLGASVGIVDLDGIDATTALRNADAAMYAAKRAGRARWARFDQAMVDSVSEEMALDADLRDALGREELVLHYQPVIDLASGALIGAEALVRWPHPTRGLLLPASFVPAAEASDLVLRLGRWVLAEACRQAVEWDAIHRTDPPLSVAVNISGRHLKASGDLLDTVDAVLGATGLEPSRLVVEITETALMENVDEAALLVAALRERGVSVAIDDFGTGYASLTYLRRLHVDSVKIDRSFVGGLGTELEDTTIVAAVIGLAKAVGVSVVAEGVETAEQVLMLRDMGCERAQGYYFSRPVVADRVVDRPHRDWAVPPDDDAAAVSGDVIPLLRAMPSPPPVDRFRVVLADDDSDDRELQRRELERTGRFEVMAEAADGETAVRLSAVHQPHLVLLDLRMPVVDGLAALPRILLAAPGAKVVLMSGHASPGAVDRALAMGAAAFYKKGVGDLGGTLLTLLKAS